MPAEVVVPIVVEDAVCWRITPAEVQQWREGVIVLCPPDGREHLISYRALYVLGRAFGEPQCRGPLRFDYRGNGNHVVSARTSRWGVLLLMRVWAVRAVSARFPGLRVGLIGLRFGAWVASRAGRSGALAAVGTWHAIADGKEYLEVTICWRKNRAQKPPSASSLQTLRVFLSRMDSYTRPCYCGKLGQRVAVMHGAKANVHNRAQQNNWWE